MIERKLLHPIFGAARIARSNRGNWYASRRENYTFAPDF